MAGISELKRLWRKYREYRTTRKLQRSNQRMLESSIRGCREDVGLEEGTDMMVGWGLGSRQDAYIEYAHDVDPRFINNPYGIGCSRTYEIPYDKDPDSLSTSPASTSPDVNDSDELLPYPDVMIRKAESIDMVEGKGKGKERERIPGDSADDRHNSLPNHSADDPFKDLLDGPAPHTNSSAKRFLFARASTQ